MKIFGFTLFLYFSLFAANSIYADNTTLISNYPAPSGSYNRVVLQNLQTPIASCTSKDIGLIFFETATNTLQLCANVNGAPTLIRAGQACFNRFCSAAGSPPCPAGNFSTGNNCPGPYSQAKNSGVNIVDSFATSAGTVFSTVCCISGSTVLPT